MKPPQWLLTFKWAVISFITIFAISMSFFLGESPKPAKAEMSGPYAPTPNDKMVGFMRHMNKDLNTDTAYLLSDAIIRNAVKYHVPVELQLGLITTESHFDQYAISSAGALGFYQVMPNIHNDKVHTMYASGEIQTKNIYDPYTQAALGTKILSDCLKKRHEVRKALFCYNGSDASIEYAREVLKNMKMARLAMK